MQVTTGAREAISRMALPFAVAVLAAVVLVMTVGAPADILTRVMRDSPNVGVDAGDESDLGDFVDAINGIKGPATFALITIVPLGLIVGGGMMAAGSRKGLQVMAASGGAIIVVLLGNGLVA